MATTPEPLDDDLAREIAVEAYLYLYPMVTMEVTRRQVCSPDGADLPGHGPMGAFTHIRQFPTADFREVVRPNFDTLYSSAWIDLGDEPWIVSAPESGDRYFLLPMLDMWSDVFASPGTRTTGNRALNLGVCPPGWTGSLPDGVERIDAPTPTVWIIGRTQTNGPADYPAVNAFQDQLSVTPLSAWGGDAPAPTFADLDGIDPTVPPLQQVNGMSGARFFALGLELMGREGPHLTDWGTVARMERLGLTAGPGFDADALAPSVSAAIDAAPTGALGVLGAQFPRLAPVTNGWMNLTDTMGVYGNFYVKRAVVAMAGLGANQPEDAIYPVLQHDADGRPLDGANRYVIHFDAGALPPADAFWSITMYDADGFQVANELDRFAIGDRDDLALNADGSLDILLQPDRPEPDRVTNWLPSVPGPLGVTMRLYEPRHEALAGTWTPPPVTRVG
ncbi:MAG: DUF1254 domain-containing protein [Microthrixaceae bacterium]